jgi:hypothetical protein
VMGPFSTGTFCSTEPSNFTTKTAMRIHLPQILPAGLPNRNDKFTRTDGP